MDTLRVKDNMKTIDVNGKLLLITDETPYTYKVITTKEGWEVLLRDNGHRIESIFISENPINVPIGEREWETLYDYKQCEAPGTNHVVEMIMNG